MERSGWPTVLASLTLVAHAVSCSAEAPRTAPAEVVQADDREVARSISKMWRDHIDAAKRKDAGAVMDIYAPECVYIVPGSADVRGHEAIAAMERATLESTDVLDAQHATVGLNIVGDVAYELGTIAGPLKSGDAPPLTVTFHYMAQWKRQDDGVWRMEHFIGEPE